MKVYVVFYDSDDYCDYLGVYSSKEGAEKSIESDIARRFDYVPERSRNCYRYNYDIIEDKVEK